MSGVYISHISLLTSLGNGAREFWEGLLAGKSGQSPSTGGLLESGFPLREAHFIDLAEKFLPAAAEQNFIGEWQAMSGNLFRQLGRALEGKNIDGLVWASGQQGFKFGDALAGTRANQVQSGKVNPDLRSLLNECGANGENAEIINHANGCVTGLTALEEAAVRIECGEWKRAVVIVTEARLRDWTLWPYYKMGLTAGSGQETPPAMRPFSNDRDGFIKGEGGALFVVESAGDISVSEPYCRIRGIRTWPSTASVFAPPADFKKSAGEISELMNASSVSAGDLSYVNLYGSGSRLSDGMEISVLKELLKEKVSRIPVSTTKGNFGHLNTGAAAVELAATAMMIKNQILIPTLNLLPENADAELNFVTGGPRPSKIQNVLKLAFGFGWQNSAALLSKA